MIAPMKLVEPSIEYDRHGHPAIQRWMLPVEPDYLLRILTDIFENYWDRIVFGPIIPGAAYEWICPAAPDRIEWSGGYLTIGFGGPHFHLCIGGEAPPADPELAALLQARCPGQASLFRSLDAHGAPNSWGFEMRNRAGDPMLSIYFANPFVSAANRLAETPDWSRLAMWRDIARRYLGRAPEAFDESGIGFGWATAA